MEISEEDKEKTDSKLFETALKNEIYAFRRIESGLVILVNSFPLETPFREDIRFSRLSYISRLLEDALKNDENILKVRKAISNTEAELGKLVMLDTEIFMQEDNQLLLKNIWDQLEKDLDDIINNN
ncbi:MAG TPA: hypothetical protein GX697_00180 [Firmicutes bacterium]|nr:hypothetical protein [Bacillota bacterium]